MPKREDIKSILVIGSGPIVIGQACEFDYSGAQACKVLREEGYRVVLVNSNPATIMTDPAAGRRHLCGAHHAEPSWNRSSRRSGPMRCLPTLGGQTGLNTAVELAKSGVLERYGVELIGCDVDAIERGEDRKLFNECMADLGIEWSRGPATPTPWKTRVAIAEELGLPRACCARRSPWAAPAAASRYDADELVRIVAQGLAALAGQRGAGGGVHRWAGRNTRWRSCATQAGNGIIVCSIENFDPMGVHTGDSITVAPAQTLDRPGIPAHARRVARSTRVRAALPRAAPTCSSPCTRETGRMVIIEMNPRVSRSSALASKATGFPIAKAAARLAVGYTLGRDRERHDRHHAGMLRADHRLLRGEGRRASPSRSSKGADDTLTTRMKAVGEVMAIGRTFEEALGKAMRSLENGPRRPRAPTGRARRRR